jgi:hypothetical protein
MKAARMRTMLEVLLCDKDKRKVVGNQYILRQSPLVNPAHTHKR